MVANKPPPAAGRSRTAGTAKVESIDPTWKRIRGEAEKAMASEPALTGFIYATVLSHDRLEDAISHRVAQRLSHADVDGGLIGQTFQDLAAAQPDIGAACRADLAAVLDRDPACERFLEPLLFFKGFHALAAYRFAHELWRQGRIDFAHYLQSECSRVFAVDIHPAARIGRGILIDHATGVVIGETAVVGDNCSFLHAVTLGGSGKQTGDRHPKVGSNVLIGAGAKVLGNIHIGNSSLIAAGSVVLQDVPPHMTVAGVPAKVVGRCAIDQPACAMEQSLGPDDYSGL